MSASSHSPAISRDVCNPPLEMFAANDDEDYATGGSRPKD